MVQKVKLKKKPGAKKSRASRRLGEAAKKAGLEPSWLDASNPDGAPKDGYRLKKNAENEDTDEYEFTEKERKSLLHRMQKDTREAWTEQLEYRRRCLKLEDYVAGRQIYDASTGRYVGHEVASAPSAEDNVDDELFIFNFTGRVHLSNVQRLSAYDIAPIVIPRSSKPEDKMGARLGKIALADMYDKMGEEGFKRSIATCISKYGTVFLKTYFDPSLGKMAHPIKTRFVTDPETGVESSENYLDETSLEPEGQVIQEVFSPRNVLLPRYCRRLADADWLEEVHVETVEWVWRKFGVVVDPEPQQASTWVTPEAVDTDQRDVEWQWGMPVNGVVVRGRFIRPCPDFQRGAIIFYTEKHILRATDLLTYFPDGDIPWEMATMVEDEKTAFGTTPLWDVLPIQDALNTDMTAIVNHIKMYGDLQMWASSTANVKVEKISNATGQINQYMGEKAPEFAKPPDLSETHFNTMNLLQQLGQSVAAAQDISRSNGAKSGNALATLQQMDNSVMRPALKSISEMLEASDCKALALMGEYYTVERVIKMTGRSGWEIIEDFTGSALNGNYDVRVSLMTGLSDNPLVRQDTVIKALDKKIIGVQEARQYLEMGESDSMLEDMQKENEVADRAVRILADPEKYDGEEMYQVPPQTPVAPGLPPPAPWPSTVLPIMLHSWDNHPMMIRKLLAYMRENFDQAEKVCQDGLTTALDFHQAQIALASAAAAPNMPVPPTGHPMPMPGPPMPPPGPVPAIQPPPGLLDSVQNPIDQPPQDAVGSPEAGPPAGP